MNQDGEVEAEPGSSEASLEETTTLPGFKSIEEFVQIGFKKLIDGTKNSNKLPCGKSRDFYEACPAFHRVMREQGEAVLTQLSRVMRHAGCKGNIQRRDDEERIEMIVDSNDTIFERVGTLLDDIAGIRRNPGAEFVAKTSKPISGSWNKRVLAARAPMKMSPAVSFMLSTSKNMDKPQLLFTDKVDNSRDTAFLPRIKDKFNLLKPLALLYEEDGDNGQYSHPYEFELEKWEPPGSLLGARTPMMYPTLEETPLVHVSSPDQVLDMVKKLKLADVIAVDLEHHSYRTFQGVTCLMQISTRDTDFIVDTIALRGDLQPLNEVLTDPSKVKVLHGAQMDVQWLQRDLSLYVVNMFDTHVAARLLSYSALSLAYLLNKFCNVNAMKHFQLADWRVRPLPEEMLQYAREDTHYLLYIFDLMSNELLEKANGQDNLLRAVYTESKQLCLTRYVKPIWRLDDYLHLYHKSKRLFDNRQLYALQQLHEWRDKTARECDESIGYVLPNHMLLHIAETLPREVQGIMACCNPVPPLVRQNLTPLHQLVHKAREQPLVRPVADEARQVDRAEVYGLSVDSPLRCPHDLAWLPEFRPDLPVLLSSPVSDVAVRHPLLFEKPTVSVFESTAVPAKRSSDVTPLTPYQRYKLVKPFADQAAKDVSNEIEDNKESIQKLESERLASLIKKEPAPAPVEETVPLRKQFESSERKTKAKLELAERKAKKMKKEPLVVIKNPFAEISTADPPAEELPSRGPAEVPPKLKTKKKKKDDGASTVPLENFDYSAVDFKKFQSNSADKLTHRNPKNKNKHKRMGKKKFKISI